MAAIASAVPSRTMAAEGGTFQSGIWGELSGSRTAIFDSDTGSILGFA
jgi:hypothetical protein